MSSPAIGYIRVSSEEQSKEGVSLDAQESRIRAYAAMRGLTLDAIYREEGVSAKTPLRKRPEGMKATEALKRGKSVKHVIAVKLDRLFRSAADALQQTQEWDKAGVSLHIIDMAGSAVDTRSAIGRMFFTMAAAFAELERNLTSERTTAALAHKRSTGRAYTRITPFGFDREGDVLVENAEEMRTVRHMEELRAQGVSLRRIAAMLNEKQTPTKLGGNWHLATVQSVLRVHRTC
jgi:DNA invertase Pin-like site-specific DNA recombinase